MAEDVGHLTRQEHNILVVDKDEAEIERIIAALTNGYIHDSAATRKEAEEKIRHNVYSVVVFDYNNLPQNGRSFLEFIKEFSPDTIPIVTTTEYDEDLEAKVLGAGAYTVLDKPIKPARLQADIANATRFRTSCYDSKTGLYTYEISMVRLGEEIKRVVGKREKSRDFSTRREDLQYLSLLLIDFDNFKGINDTYGHINGGDVVLRRVSDIIRRNSRPGDIGGRYGGDELIVGFPGLPYENEPGKGSALRKAEQIRQDVETSGIESKDGRVMPVTVTIGVAAIPQKEIENTPEGLIAAADEALYEGKLVRNRVVGYRELKKPK